jgi:hypothetical protein
VVVKATPKAPSSSGNDNGSSGVTPTVLTTEINMQFSGGQQTVRGFDNELLLNIPAGAFAQGVPLIIRKLDSAVETPGQFLYFASPIYELDTAGSVPGKPVYITLKFNPALLGGTDPRQLGIYRQSVQEPSKWVYIGGVVDLFNNQITVQLNGFSRYAVLANKPVFDDLTGHWSQKEVEILAAHNLVEGVGEGRFQPDRSITRAELAKLLVKLAAFDTQREIRIQASPTALFTDVLPGAWYREAVETAARLGLVNGSEGKFRPDDLVTREEMAAMMLRAISDKDKTTQGDAAVLPFKDLAKISPWAADIVALAWNKGLMQGINTEYFQPEGTATRAQAAVVVLRVMERMGLLTSTSVVKGSLTISELEGTHFELNNCTSSNETYVLVPVSEEIRSQLAKLAGQNVQVTGFLVQGVSQYMSGPVLRVLTVAVSSSQTGN